MKKETSPKGRNVDKGRKKKVIQAIARDAHVITLYIVVAIIVGEIHLPEHHETPEKPQVVYSVTK